MPPSQLFQEERRRRLLNQLVKLGRVGVNELSAEMNVSVVTIRQDLKALEAEGLLIRTHGGAVLVPTKPVDDGFELSFHIRRKRQLDEKDVLGRFAASMVESGSAISFDASTTVCSVIPYLSHLDPLTIVTNNLMVAEMVVSNMRIQLFLAGGRLRQDSYSVVDNPKSLPEMNLNIGFFSAWGISPEAGLTEVNEGEMHMKQALMQRCRTKVLLLDSSKWGRVAPYTYATPEEMDIILTTDHVRPSIVNMYPHAKIEQIPL